MRIVHVAAYFAPAWAAGGPARSVLTLCQAQRDAGLHVEVFTTTANGATELPASPERTVYEGVPVRYFPLARPKALFAAPSMRGPLRQALEHADAAHIHGLFNATVWMAGRLARTRVPYVLSPRGMLQQAALRHHVWRKRAAWQVFDRALLHGARRWHGTSPSEADALRGLAAGIPIVEIPNLVVEAADRALRLPSSPYVLFLGRIHAIKRLDLLPRAMTLLQRHHPGAMLVIAGPDQRDTQTALQPEFATIGASVRWTGAVAGDVKRGLLAGARALVLCSDSESFGMSAAEAMAAGTPVVVTRTCPWAAVETEGCGYWVAQDPAAIAAALVRLFDNPVLAREMGRRGRSFMRREFSPPAVAARWVEAYRDLARDANPRAMTA